MSVDRGRKRSLDVTGGPAQAAARSMLRAMGWTTEELQLPQAGVAATWNRVTPCNMHLDELALAAADELKRLRVLPLVFHTISVSDGIAMGTDGMRASLPSRDWIADSVELVMVAERMDGLFAIAGCDKTLPGMMMAMIRLDLPAVFAYGGSIRPGCFRGKDVSIQDVYEAIGAQATGRMSLDDLTELECVALPGKGSCASMYTANTMASISEALGLTVPGMASPAAEDAAREEIVRAAAATLVDALEHDRRPSTVLSKASFENAMTVAAALGGSTNACLHVPALAGEAGIDFGLADIDRISRRTPQIAEMRPAGRFMMQDLHVEGGVPVVMRELLDAGLLDGEAMTVTGQTIAEALATVTRSPEPRTPVLHTVAEPVRRSGGYVVLWGNLAPDGAVIKVANQESNSHRGPAKVFDTEQEAFQAVSAGQIAAGDVVVVRYQGPKGGPGMPEMTHLTAAIVGAGLVEQTALLTDGRFGGGTQGTSVGHISPEAAAGGPLAVIRDGDVVEIDPEGGRLHVELGDDEIAARLARVEHPPPRCPTGVLAKYARLVGSAATGARVGA
ncbi:MAG: dihydroxy-acid dehydratase [Gaiellales bacterium]